jgi:hypothetical protein
MKKYLIYYSVPILMVAIALFQIIQIPKGLTRWKGGGFGMYSEMHPNYRNVVINDSLYKIDSLKINSKKHVAVKKYAFFPKEKYLQSLAQTLDLKSDTIRIEVWQLDFDAKKRQLTNKKIKSDVYIKN